MNVKSVYRAAIAAILTACGGGAWAACDITPEYSIIAKGQTVTLTATCAEALTSIDWKVNSASVTGVINLSSAQNSVTFITPLSLDTATYTFDVVGTSGQNPVATGKAANVVVTAASALAAGGNLNTVTDGACGTAHATAVAAMPSGTAQCASGTPALLITTPTAYNWTCTSPNSGTDASCYAIRGFTVLAQVNGGHGTVNSLSQPVAANAVASVIATPDTGYSASMYGCGGSQSGNTFTTGPVTANCTVTATFSNTPVANACGTANNGAFATAPSTGLCGPGNTPSSVTTNAGDYTWTCAGVNTNPATVTCSAARQFTVTASVSGGNGSVAPPTQLVRYNQTATLTATPAANYTPSFSSACGGSQSGNNFTAGAVAADCAVSVSFAVNQAPAGDPGRWTGSWQTTNTAGEPVLVVDQSFSQGTGTLDYLPGCVNQGVTNNSYSGCAANNYYSGPVAGGGNASFSFVPGKVLAIRLKTTATAGNSAKGFQLSGADGGNTGASVPRMWLSTEPGGPALTSSAWCNRTSSASLYVVTGPGYCTITPNGGYYLNIETTAAATPSPRFKLAEDPDFY